MKLTKIESVLIVGCGWVGTKLAETLISNNIKVFGTTRSVEKATHLSSINIEPIILELETNEPISLNLPTVDSVVISISPGKGDQRSQYPLYIEKLSKLLALTNPQVIMYSSTSAYNGKKGIVTESDAEPNSENDNLILAAEGKLRKIISDSVILRLGGLYGSDRHPVRYLAGRDKISNGDSPVNLVHREDVINATTTIIAQKVLGKIFNVCSEHHPTKQKFYTELAKKLDLENPTFEAHGIDNKLVVATKIKNEIGFEYQHNDLFAYEPD